MNANHRRQLSSLATERVAKTPPRIVSNAQAHHLLDGIAARGDGIGQLRPVLSHAGFDRPISLRPHLHDMAEALVAALGSPEQAVKVVHTGSDCMVPLRQVQPIVLLLCEIFINAMKYAHPAGVPLILLVDCEAGDDGRLALTICDDGVGLPEGFQPEHSSGLGFRVMRSLAAEIGGELRIQSTHLGLSFRLSLPAGATAVAQLA